MDESQARNLVKTTFENPYSRERFLIFSKNLFRRFEPKTFVYRGKYIPDAYSTHVKTLKRIGKFKDEDNNKIDILAVQLKKSSSLERARTMQRNFIAWYLNGSRGNVSKDAALVAFYTKKSNNWRLSLVKMDYSLGKSKAGKIKAITELTPARRFSFAVGKDENTHTAQRQLLPVLQKDDTSPVLSDLEQAFSVEVVTKDFFEKYKTLFLKTREELDRIITKDAKIKSDFVEKNIDPVDFAKKLLGQIVFLYFLQKKGWFGVERDEDWGTGPKDFLRRLFNGDYLPAPQASRQAGDNFFNDILEPLFYEALAIERPDDFYSKFNCKIPFLNGGLFDPLGNYDWVHTDIRLPDELFSNNRKTREGDTGDGILDVFDRYNFTVKEDEPLEREVAVDPEMLGKVFENLLEVKDRKSKGTYYTPREIVHYMCQESLVNYLTTETDSKVKRDDIETLIRLGETVVEHDSRVVAHGEETETYKFKLPQSIRNNASLIDESLEKIKVCDPAVGSGAFLVGMMTEVVRVRNVLTNYLLARPKPSGEGGPKNDRSIYAFKRHAIQNCLYGVDIDPGAEEIAKLRLWLSLVVDEQERYNIQALPNLDYKIMQGNSLLEEYEGVKLFPDESEMEQTNFMEIVSESERMKKEIKQLKDKFFKTAQKSAKDKLKAEIERLTWGLIEASVKEQNKLSLLPEIERFKKANIKPFFLWKLNFSEVFEKSDGFDVVIANPPYVDSETMTRNESDTRRIYSQIYASAKGNWDLFVIFIEKGTQLLKKEGVISYIVPNKLIGAKYTETLRELLLTKTIKEIRDYSEVNVFKEVAVYPVVFIIQNTTNHEKVEVVKMSSINEVYQANTINPEVFYEDIYWDKYLVNDECLQIVLKISGNKKLYEFCENVIGAATVSEAYEIKKLIKEENSVVGSKYKKLINTGTLDPYISLWGKQKTQYLKESYIRPVVLEDDLKNKYPTRFEQAVTNKIIVGGMTKRLEAFYDKGSYLAGKSTTILLESPKIDSYFLLALLNSQLISFWYRIYFRSLTLAGGYLRINNNEIKKIPVCEFKGNFYKQVIDLVREILAIAEMPNYLDNSKKIQNVQELISQIDQLVYKLYCLTPEEIAIVESV